MAILVVGALLAERVVAQMVVGVVHGGKDVARWVAVVGAAGVAGEVGSVKVVVVVALLILQGKVIFGLILRLMDLVTVM